MAAERTEPAAEGRAGARPRRRIWCETIELEDLAHGPALELIARFAIDPIVAVRPDSNLDDVARIVLRARDLGLEPAVWPMLADADGRWCSAFNASVFAAFVDRLAADLEARNASQIEFAIDLEPPIAAVRAAFVDRVGAAYFPLVSVAPLDPARRVLASLVARLADRGSRAFAAIAPPILAEPKGGEGWQRALGTPVDGIAWSSVSAMLYTSIVEGWSRKLLNRAATTALLERACRAARERFGERAAASLGAVGHGALGSEPVYRSTAELAEDVGIARASGIEDLALFELGGVIRKEGREGADAWLSTFVTTEPSAPMRAMPLGARVALGLLVGAGAVTGLSLGELSRHKRPAW